MAADAAREDTIRALFPLVRAIARRIARMIPGSDADDLVGDGCIGCIRAVDTFDASRGTTLRGYASRIIAGAMLNGLRRLDPVSERVRRELREADRERFAAAVQDGALPSQTEMEQRRPALRRAVFHAYRYTPLSLDAALPPNEGLRGDWNADPCELAAASGERHVLRAALHELPARQRHVVALHYFAGKSLHEIGRTMAISPQRASQLHLAALKKLRRAMHVAH